MTTSIQIGKGLAIDVNFGAMPQTALDHILYIGARNVLMDCHASVTKDAIRQEFKDDTMTDEELTKELQEQALAMATKKLDALMRGEVRTVSTRESVDPVRAEAIKIARGVVTARLKKEGKKLSDYEPAAIKGACDKIIANDPAIMAQAQKNVDAAKALTTGDVALSDLGL